MKYLILDKKQRVEVPNEDGIATGTKRLTEELEKQGIQYDIASYDNLEFEFIDGETWIKARGADVKKYSHIIFRGHALHRPQEYEFKRYIIDYIEQYNSTHPEQKVLVQNAEAIKRLPYYNKIAMAIFCSQNNIPYFDTYYRSDGDYKASRDMLNDYPLIMKEYAGVNRLQVIKGQEKIKKNVFKIDSLDGFQQEFLNEQDHSRFFLQEFSDTSKDMRIFVKLGQVIGGWTREAKDGFMTVKDGKYSTYNNPEPQVKEIAEKVAQLLDADFIAVDFMYLGDKLLLQEISLHPGFKAYETKIEGEPVNIAEAIVTAFK